MEFNLDLFVDEVASSSASVAGKFKPKPKFKPKKGAPLSIPPALCSVVTEDLNTQASISPGLEKPTPDVRTPSESDRTKESSRSYDVSHSELPSKDESINSERVNSTFQGATTGENEGRNEALPLEDPWSDGNGEFNPEADEEPPKTLPDSVFNNASDIVQIQPQAKPKPSRETSASSAYIHQHGFRDQVVVPSSTDSGLTWSDPCFGDAQCRLDDSDLFPVHSSDIPGIRNPLEKGRESFSVVASHVDDKDGALLNSPSSSIENGKSGNPVQFQHLELSVSDNSMHFKMPTRETGSVIEFQVSDRINCEPDAELPQSPKASMDMNSRGPLQLDAPTSNGSGDLKANFGRPAGQNADIFFGLEFLDDFLSQSTAPMGNSQPEVDENAQPTLSVSNFKQAEEETVVPVASVDSPSFLADGSMNTGTVEAFPSQVNQENISDMDFASGPGIRKCTPKPKFNPEKGNSFTSVPPFNTVETSLLDSQLVPPDFENTGGSTDSPSLPFNLTDLSSARFNDPVPTVPTSGNSFFDEEPASLAEASISDGVIPQDNVDTGAVRRVNIDLGAKNRKRKSSSRSDCHGEVRQCSAINKEKSADSSRQLRKRMPTCKLVNESTSDACESGDFLFENHSGSIRDEGDGNGDENRVDITSQKRRATRKSKKRSGENAKTVRKPKNAKAVQEEPTNEPPKNFSRSTRRSRRQVEKVLLETPDDELDRQNLRFKDLILLAEHKEWLASKETATSKTSFTSRSSGDHFRVDGPHGDEGSYDDNNFASEQARCSDGEEDGRVEAACDHFNYQTYMVKLPKSRWSKQDTELFYEGVRQFGADISMIQQLFPNLVRRQVLLKFKKEERQHPSRLDDALRNRTKDHSHFERVIERLKQAAGQEKSNSNKGDSVGTPDERMEEAMEEAEVEELEVTCPKVEGQQQEGMHKEEEMREVEGAASPARSVDSDDDFLRWTEYKSEL